MEKNYQKFQRLFYLESTAAQIEQKEQYKVKSSQQTKVNCSMFMYFSISSIDNVTSSFKVKLKKINKRTDN